MRYDQDGCPEGLRQPNDECARMAASETAREEAKRWLIEHNHHGCHVDVDPGAEMPLPADVDSLAELLDRMGRMGVTTAEEWDDAQRRLGNRPKAVRPRTGTTEGQ